VPTDRFTRSTAYLIAEEVADAAARAYATGKPIDIEPLLQTIELMADEDMPDQVRAKLHKITGYVLRDSGRGELALSHLHRALQLHIGCGVKKDIERLAVKLKNAASR
ncbi:phage terminase small subunit, partial [Yersinia enterocolitica]